MRRHYKSVEVSAYVLGIILSVLIILVWPALMLLVGVFSCSSFAIWSILVVVLIVISALYLGLVPPFVEIVQVRLISICVQISGRRLAYRVVQKSATPVLILR